MDINYDGKISYLNNIQTKLFATDTIRNVVEPNAVPTFDTVKIRNKAYRVNSES